MNIVVIGSGGREHAIIKKLRENKEIQTIWALPGNAGMDNDATCVPIKATDLEAVLSFVTTHPVDYVVVAPDDPLVLGMADALRKHGIPCFGPNANAAMIEGSKIFAKELMKKYQIPTAAYEVFTDYEKAVVYLSSVHYPLVIKADGLALGKGVIIAQNQEEAKDALYALMKEERFGKSGSSVVIEEFLTGTEVSVLAFTDGKTIVPLPAAMDHKKALEHDLGLNTGGMGSIAPLSAYTEEIAQICYDTIYRPTIEAMNKEERPFQGCLYFGLILTADGPKVIEYNCRFGDPEAQVVLPLLKSDLLTIMQATNTQTLAETTVECSSQSVACVVLANEGYPEHYDNGARLSIPPEILDHICFAGVAKENNQLVVHGGRILNVVALADSLPEALHKAYTMIDKIQAEHTYYRRDIGVAALRLLEKE